MKTYIVLVNSTSCANPRELCEELEDQIITADVLETPTETVINFIQGENMWECPEEDNIKVMDLSEYMDTMNDTDEDTITIFNNGEYDVDCSFMAYVHFEFILQDD